jgi:hypothetical protein
MGLDTKTDRLTVSRNVTLTLTVTTSRYYVYNERTARLRVQRSPTSKRPTTCPASAEPARALPTGMNLQSAAFTADTMHRQPSAEHLGRLPTRCPPNLARCCSSQPARTAWRNSSMHHPETALLRAATHSASIAPVLHSGGAVISIRLTWWQFPYWWPRRDCYWSVLIVQAIRFRGQVWSAQITASYVCDPIDYASEKHYRCPEWF